MEKLYHWTMEVMRVEILYLLKIWQKDLLHAQKGEPAKLKPCIRVETTIKNLAECINELTGNKTPADLKPARDWDHPKRLGNFKIKEKLNFSATVS